MKLLERVLDSFIQEMVDIDAMQFGIVPGFFIFRRLQEKYIAANKPLYFAFVDLEKAFDRVPRKVLWWALRSLGVEEWAVCVIQGMYTDVKSCVCVNGQYSKEFGLEYVCIRDLFSAPCFSYLCRKLCHASSVLVCLAYDIAVMADSLEECIARLKLWKEGIERKGLSQHEEDKAHGLRSGLDLLRDWSVPLCSLSEWCWCELYPVLAVHVLGAQ